MLLQLPSFSQIPGAHGVIQAAGPQLGPIVRDVYAAGPVGVALELPAGKTRRLRGARGPVEAPRSSDTAAYRTRVWL